MEYHDAVMADALGYTGQHDAALHAAKEGNLDSLKCMIEIGARDYSSMMKMAKIGHQDHIVRYLRTLI